MAASKTQIGRQGAGEAAAPLLTVITSTLNAGHALAKTIESLARQDFEDFEYIVIDGGSTDSTLSIIEHGSDVVDRWVSEPDSGIYDAWNKGVRLSRGRWISFLGAGDRYLPGALTSYADFLRACPDVEYVCSLVRDGIGPDAPTVGQPLEWATFRRRMLIAHPGSFHRKDLFERFGEFDTSYRITGDYEFLLRPGSCLRAGFTPVITAEMEPGGVSQNRPFAAFAEAARAKRQRKAVPVPLIWSDAAWSGLKRAVRLITGRLSSS